MFKDLLNKLAGNPYERELERYKEIVSQVNAHEVELKRQLDITEYAGTLVTDEIRAGLLEKTQRFRALIQERVTGIDDHVLYLEVEGEALVEILPEAFAAVRVASILTIGLRHYDVQLIGGIVLHEGRIAEMRTGEGKTLVATLPLYLNALTGRGAHLVTVNDYLARRDGGWMGPIYNLLGLSTGVIGKERYSAIYDPGYVDPGGEMEDERLVHWRPVPRRECYRADITYGTASEFGFDYLRDNTATDIARTVQPSHPYAIVDEVDSVLIDSARTPLIISGPAEQASSTYMRFAQIVDKARLRKNTTDLEFEEPDGDYEIDDRTQSVSLTERGIEKIELQLPEIDTQAGQSIYDPQFYELVHYLENAIKAKYNFHRDKEYMVQNGRVILIDQTTGRPMPSRRYSEGLHQAIEAKEGVQVQRENVTIATITVQNYFRLYDKLSGMTGTALTQAEEFDEVYALDVIAIPTNVEYRADSAELEVQQDRDEGVPVITYWLPDNPGSEPDFFKRTDYADQVYQSIKGKFTAAAEEISELNHMGRPILVGTGSVEASEMLSSILKKNGLKHEVLNAKNHQSEALLVAQAGRPGAVTISTSMAGRGTDILLGGNPEGLANKLIADKGFSHAALHRVVTEVVRDNLDKARQIAKSEAYMDESIVDWTIAENEELTRKASVDDILAQVAKDVREDVSYREIDFELLLQLLQQLDLAQIDPARVEKAQQIATDANLPPSLVPDLQYRVNQYRSLSGLLGQSGHTDMLAQHLMEQHFQARSALVRAVLNDEINEARQITTRIPNLPASLIDDILGVIEDCRQSREQVWDLGGLHVISTERHEARRIDDQLRGRAGRQGDPGSSRFYLSLEDELMLRFGGERTKNMMSRLNIPEDMPISANILSNAIEQAQGRFESYNFDIRKSLIEYDEAVNRQRQIVYDERHEILAGASVELDDLVRRFIEGTLDAIILRLRDNYESWAMAEVETVLTDFSNLETGEVNTRGVVQRIRSLLPRLSQEELDEVLSIVESDELLDVLHELVLDAIDEGHNFRMMLAEISRVVPLWPVFPPVGAKGVEDWESFVERVRAVFGIYTHDLPDTQRTEVLVTIDTDFEALFREQLTWAGRNARPQEIQAQLYARLSRTLESAFESAVGQMENDELIGVLLERVDGLLTIAHETTPDQSTNGSGLSPEQRVYGIGAEEMINYERALMLSVIDGEWRQYLRAIDDLRQGISLEAYGQRDPKIEFKRRAFEMFDKLRDDVREGVAKRFFGELPRHRTIVEQQKKREELLDQLAQQGYRVQRTGKTGRGGAVKIKVQKDMWSNIGRNDPCPCGSGKKFKDCHYHQIREQMNTVDQKQVTQGGRSSKRRRRR